MSRPLPPPGKGHVGLRHPAEISSSPGPVVAFRARVLLPFFAFLGLLVGPVASLNGQQLSLKREIPGGADFSCPPFEPAFQPNEEERTEARRLASDADQALILGDLERATELLTRATELDPASPGLRYNLARVMEDMGSEDEALSEYCRVVALSPQGEEFEDSRSRIDAILEKERGEIPQEAVDVFARGIEEAERGRFESALRSFDSAESLAPRWPAAVYNRGLLHARLGRVGAAEEDLERYLELEPSAPDASAVSQGIGRLQALRQLPNPVGAMTLGLVFPGAGQFYTGRPWGGLTVLTLAGGAIAAGYLVEEVTVRCVGSVSGDNCPPERIIGEDTDTPYLVHGLAVAGAVAFAGAIESFFGARSRRNREVRSLVDLEPGGASLSGPEISARGARLELQFLKVNF